MREDGGLPPFGGWEGGLAVPANAGALAKWGLIVVGVIILVVGLNFARSIYTNWLWFSSVGFLSVFTTILWTRIWLFLAGAIVFGFFIAVNILLARRYSRGESVLPLPTEAILWLNRLMMAAIILVAVILGIVFGVAASGRWELVLKLANATSFGTPDPVFGKDISFFVFTLPVLEWAQGWFQAAFIVLLVATGAMYLAFYSLRGVSFVATPRIRGHLAVLGSLLFIALAAGHLLSRYKLLFSESGAVVGATYADVFARLPAQMFLVAVALACAVLLVATLLPALQGPRGTRLIIGAVGLWIGAVILAGNLYPSAVQRFTVQPNEFNKESPFIERNITFTREAFGLGRIKERPIQRVQREMSAEILSRNTEIIDNLRLWDPDPLKNYYKISQFHSLFYDFLDVDVDRYTIDGKYRQVLVSARELDQDKLKPEAKNWVNLRLRYTHGYGAVASPATEFTAEGQPAFLAAGVPPTGSIPIERPGIYYSERSPNFVIVNSKTAELDYEEKGGVTADTNYEGNGGVPLSSFIRRLVYAWQFGDINILISSQVTPESRIQYRRSIQEQIQHVAPFLTLDRDPYLVIEDGRLRWIQDAYTTTNRYPYSTPFRNSINYIRNSVKVVVDAYDGAMVFYVSDPDDPLVRTYQSIFPVLFKPLNAMSPFLKGHLRYPEDIFSIQAEMYLQYHMTIPNEFFGKLKQWDVPEEFFFGAPKKVEPYYVNMKLPDEDRVEFVLILPFTLSPTKEKPNMVTWLAARMDEPHYGELTVYAFGGESEIHGPAQVEARIDNNPVIKPQFALLCTGEAQCHRGNLLVVPIEDSILYVEPLYLESTTLRFPELKSVILASGTKVVMESTLERAVAALVGAPAGPVTQPPSGQPPPVLSEAAQQLKRIQQALQSLRDGLITLEEAVRELSQILQGEQK